MKSTLRLLFICILSLSNAIWGMPLYAQKQGRALADSLLREMESKNDTMKVKYLINISRIYFNYNYDTGIKYSNDGLKLAQSVNWPKGIGLCYENLGTLSMLKSEYPVAIDCYFNALKYYEEIKFDIGIGITYGNIATIFQYQNKYEEGIKYEKLALTMMSKETGNQNRVANVLGNIGILFWRKQETDSALSYSFRALKIYDSLDNIREVAKTNGNIGMIYGDAGNYDKALEFDLRSLKTCKQIAEMRSSTGITYGNIGLVYLKIAEDSLMNNKAGKYIPPERSARLDKALAYIDSAIAIDTAFGGLYELQEYKKYLAKVYEMSGNYKSAYENYIEYIGLRDSVFSTENKVKIAKAEAKHELELKEKQIKIGQLELGKQQNEKWFLIVGIFMLMVIGIMFINSQRLKQRKLAAEKKNAESDLEMAVIQLNNFRQSIHEKNSIIEHITNEIAAMKTGTEQEINNETLLQLERSILLTDEQWESFRILFEKVHKGFFQRVKEKMPDLTPAELRFVALSKLKLTPKEMASMLGISSNSIRNYRHRLRRKLDLSEDASIEEVADAI